MRLGPLLGMVYRLAVSWVLRATQGGLGDNTDWEAPMPMQLQRGERLGS